MDNEYQRDRQLLAQLPDSPRKKEALRLLAEMERLDAEQKEGLEKLERSLNNFRPGKMELHVYRLLPWVAFALGSMAGLVGIEAILSQEFCFRLRSTWSCKHGLDAQVDGLVILLVGVILLLLPLPAGRWRSFGLWSAGFTLFLALLGSIVVR